MVQIWLRRFGPLSVAVAAFLAYWASIAFGWLIPLWAYAVSAVTALALAALLSQPTRRREASRADLYASDPYSDAYLGRTSPTPPVIDTKPTAQHGPGLPDDPLHLPQDRP